MCLAVVTGLTKASSVDGNRSAGHAGIAFIYLFSMCFSFCITPLQTFYISECLDLETRAKGGAAGQIVASIAGIVGQYTTGVAIDHIGYYYYLVFVFWDCFEALVVYLFFPETKVSSPTDSLLDYATPVGLVHLLIRYWHWYSGPNPRGDQRDLRGPETRQKVPAAAVLGERLTDRPGRASLMENTPWTGHSGCCLYPSRYMRIHI
jgi:hypothetical protein